MYVTFEENHFIYNGFGHQQQIEEMKQQFHSQATSFIAVQAYRLQDDIE